MGNRRTFRAILVVAVCIALAAAPAQTAEWGDLHLKFKYDGEPPEPRALVVDKEVAVCGRTKLLDESLLVDKESRGIADVVVMLLKPTDRDVPVHESYEKSAKEPVKIVSRNCRFEPHVLVMRTTQPFHWDNLDPIGHNPSLLPVANAGAVASLPIPIDGKLRLNFSNEEPNPFRIDCNIHPWMSAVVIVRGNPYAAASDKRGNVTLKNVPAGEWTFGVWQERAANLKQVRQGGKTLEWAKGHVKLTIKPGENDLGEILIPAEAFSRR